jgi:methionyl-tRNA formyltransferase
MATANQSIRAAMFTVVPFAVTLYEELLRSRGHRLVGVLTAPGPRSRRTDEFKEVAALARPGLDVIVSNYPDRWAEMIRPWKPDLIFCMGFNWKLPPAVLELPALGAYNFHDACLPKNRGRNSIGWALRTGGPDFGVTLHRMTPAFDDGAILSQRAIEVLDDDDVDSLFLKMVESLRAAQHEALDRLLAGDPGTPQDESQATYTAGAFEPEWREIDWAKPARDVHFQVRSWCGIRGVPRGAFGVIDGERALVTKTQLVRDIAASSDVEPGTVLARDGDSLLIQCGDGPLRILQWRTATPDDEAGSHR